MEVFFSSLLASVLLLPSVFVNAGVAKPFDPTERVTSGITYTHGGKKEDTIEITSCEKEVYLDRHFPARTWLNGLKGVRKCRHSHVTVDPRNPEYINSGQGFVMETPPRITILNILKFFLELPPRVEIPTMPEFAACIIGKCPRKLNLPNEPLDGWSLGDCLKTVEEVTVEPGNAFFGKLPGTKTGVYSKHDTLLPDQNNLRVKVVFMNRDELSRLPELRLTKDMPKDLDIKNFVYKADRVIFEDPKGDAVCTPESFHIPKHLTPDYPGIWDCITRAKKVTVDPANKHFKQYGPYVMSAGNFYEGIIKVCPLIPEGNDWILHISADAPKGLDNCIKKATKS